MNRTFNAIFKRYIALILTLKVAVIVSLRTSHIFKILKDYGVKLVGRVVCHSTIGIYQKYSLSPLLRISIFRNCTPWNSIKIFTIHLEFFIVFFPLFSWNFLQNSYHPLEFSLSLSLYPMKFSKFKPLGIQLSSTEFFWKIELSRNNTKYYTLFFQECTQLPLLWASRFLQNSQLPCTYGRSQTFEMWWLPHRNLYSWKRLQGYERYNLKSNLLLSWLFYRDCFIFLLSWLHYRVCWFFLFVQLYKKDKMVKDDLYHDLTENQHLNSSCIRLFLKYFYFSHHLQLIEWIKKNRPDILVILK